ncbi:MAG: imidazole glycerol phosphate synthase subunit HisH [Robiginitomaculum sp.]|nr:imidazole glycerol phosphate synthase subunit HisH [Robiginitomaculum sp.]
MCCSPEIMLVDTGCANLASVRFAFARLGVTAVISCDPDKLRTANRLVLPGVGSASAGMKALDDSGLAEMLTEYQRPLLGICLGMQMLFEHSNEGDTACLGLVGGEVEALPTQSLPIPHMGWNTLNLLRKDPLLTGIKQQDYVYFVHSFAAKRSADTLAISNYGMDFSAIIRRGNSYGCQFHPELSGMVGARILQNFLKVK